VPFAQTCLDSGYRSLRDVKSITLDQATAGELVFTVIDPQTGAALDLSGYGSSSSSSGAEFTGIKLSLKEMPGDNQIWAIGELTVAGEGQLALTYTTNFTRRAGIFTAQLELWQDGVITRVIPYFVIINPNLRATSSNRGLSLSVPEIRMVLRDTDPEGNFLLEELDFTDNEIALCIRRCVDYWNECPPPVNTYKATNFPWRYNLSLGVAALLHQMAANNKMRNDLPYQAAGLTVQDTIKYQQYMEFYKMYWDQWVAWVRSKKYQINIDGGFVILGSGFAEVSE
jgi:hypothetical protein